MIATSPNPPVIFAETSPKSMPLAAVTGAFSYSGKYIARQLLAAGIPVLNMTGSPHRPDPFNGTIKSIPYRFDDPSALAASLQGVHTLYNTYWVRFDHGDTTHSRAVANTRTLLKAAVNAGVQRVVHISITNPSVSSNLPYFKGKAELEAAIQSSGLSYAILRPTVIFSLEDILINNIAWLLRHFPAFAIPGDGSYALQPIFVEDLARLAVQSGLSDQNMVVDAVGPEIYTFEELVKLIASAVGSRSILVKTPPWLALFLSRLVGLFTGDVVLTADEVEGLMAGLLISDKAPTGSTSLRSWLQENHNAIGIKYASELHRHYHSQTHPDAG